MLFTEVMVYECSLCSTKFSRKDNLLRHARNTHPGEKITIKMSPAEPNDSDQFGDEVENVPVRKSVIVSAPPSQQTFPLRQPVIQLAPSSKKQLIAL